MNLVRIRGIVGGIKMNKRKREIIENILLGIGIVFIYDFIFLLWFIK